MPAPQPFDLPPDLLDAAAALLERPEPEREAAFAALLAAHPAHANGLREFVLCLASSDRLLDGLQTPPPPVPPEFADYRVLRTLGEGAFGIVYLCEQPAPVQRQVAIKVLRPGAGDRGTLARFDAERRFLARLGHPAIGQIFATGLLPDGRPWFAMEHVPGVPIADYCDRQQLAIDARLRLFVRLCQGVQHAHDQGIVHRDLKPANVLVVEVDGEPQPKIIDFGVARALAPLPVAGGPRTETGRVVGTPGYMSPEQMAGDLAAIDARSDVFSLGVMLYELLTGELPWGKRPASTDSEPLRPSSRVTTGDARVGAVAQQRASQPKRLAAQLRGDLDWIVLKALAREPHHRYATALELAADVQRHLRSDTVIAGPPALGYRLQKFVRRHRAAVATSGVAAVAIAAGLWLLHGYRQTANERASDAEAAVASLLARANDARLRNSTQYAALRRSLGEEAVALYDRFLRQSPADATARLGRVRAITTLAAVHFSLGDFAAAANLARDAVADGERLVAAAPDDTAAASALALAARHLGHALQRQGRPAEARASLQRAVDLYERLRTDQPSTTDTLVAALESLAVTFDQDREDAERTAVLTRAAGLQDALVRAHPEQVALREEAVNLAILRASDAGYRGEFANALAMLAPASAWLADGQGLSRGVVIKVRTLLANLAACTGDTATAVAQAESGVATCRAWMQMEPDSPQPVALANDLLSVLCNVPGEATSPTQRATRLRDWVDLCGLRLDRFPEDALGVHPFVDSASRLGEELLTSGKRDDLRGLDPMLRRACVQSLHLPESLDAVARRMLRWRAHITAALVADALGLADANALWQTAAGQCGEPDAAGEDAWFPPQRVQVALRLTAHHLAHGRLANARALLDRTDSLLTELAEPDRQTFGGPFARAQVLVAAAQGDLAAATRRLDALLTDAGDWRERTAAADAAYGLWQACRRRGDNDTANRRDQLVAACQRAIEACDARRAPAHDDPWLELPIAKCRLRIALAQRDRGEAPVAHELAAVVADLANWRERVHADQWDDELLRAGEALLRQ